jgi:hypothetical protein
MGDQEIINTDIPERLQLRYKGKFCDSVELIAETNWISDKLIKSHNLVSQNADNFRKNIMKALELMRVYSYEIMYIHLYKQNEISLEPGALRLADLWQIWDYDNEWAGIWSRKNLVQEAF